MTLQNHTRMPQAILVAQCQDGTQLFAHTMAVAALLIEKISTPKLDNVKDDTHKTENATPIEEDTCKLLTFQEDTHKLESIKDDTHKIETVKDDMPKLENAKEDNLAMSDSRQRYNNYIKEKQYNKAYDVVIDMFMEKFDKIEHKGKFRSGTLSWPQLQKLGFVKDTLYDRCCDRLHDGSKDPRDKTDEFHVDFHEMQLLLRTWCDDASDV